MVVIDQERTRFLRRANRESVTAFLASCVERASDIFFLSAVEIGGRAVDGDTYLTLLDDLWRSSGLSSNEIEDHLAKISKFSELQSEEEPAGIAAFAFDAVVAMESAYAYVSTGDPKNVDYCSNSLLNSAGFIDDLNVTTEDLYELEVGTQYSDIKTLSSRWSREYLEDVRERSRSVSRTFSSNLRLAFL